ncbi:MAG TPA: tetratricopeptide repeat protein [Rhizomicrobium sp.]|nr:tetratricopeptide repeat protein [Rhizomicrobium sp.]
MNARLFAGFLLASVAAGVAGGALASAYSDFNAGIAAHNHGNWDEAIRRMNLALAAPDLLASFRVPAYIDRGDAYLGKKDWAAATADYSAALALDPDDLEALLRRAATYGRQKKYDAAIADYTSVIRLLPGDAVGYAARGFLYEEEDNLDPAIADFTAIIGLAPQSDFGYSLRGNALRRKGDYEKAIADQDKAVDLDDKSPGNYFERAQTYLDEGEYRSAISDAIDGLRLKPDDSDGRLQLGLAQWEYGRFSDATATFAGIVKAQPQFAYGVLWRALAQAKSGEAYDAEFAKNAAALDLSKWPAPLIRLYLGQATVDDAVKAAASSDPDTLKNQTCEADFYAGEWQYLHGNQAAGLGLLQAAQAGCRHDFVEYDAAVTELKHLK